MFRVVPRLSTCGLLAVMLWTSGCVCVPWTHCAAVAATHPARHAGTTIVFIESPRDMWSISGLANVSDHFNEQGINAVYFDPMFDCYDPQTLAELIRHLKQDLGQRVMLVGWSLGGAVGLDAAEVLATQGVELDTFVMLDLYNLNRHRGLRVHPPNICRMVVARSTTACIPEGFRNPVTYVIGTWNHLAVPTHRDTINMLYAEVDYLSALPVAE